MQTLQAPAAVQGSPPPNSSCPFSSLLTHPHYIHDQASLTLLVPSDFFLHCGVHIQVAVQVRNGSRPEPVVHLAGGQMPIPVVARKHNSAGTNPGSDGT